MRKNNALIAEYLYDHAGLRYKKIDYVTSKTTIYVYGQGTEPLYEEVYNNANLITPTNKVSYLNMRRQRIAKSDNGSISYYFTDHLGSTRIVVDAAGNATKMDFQPFGADFGSTTSERYKFTGKEDDSISDLYYYNARYYSPQTGRFVSEDIQKDGHNWYLYCKNNPVYNVDPDGKTSYNFMQYRFEKIVLVTETGMRKYSTDLDTLQWADMQAMRMEKNGLIVNYMVDRIASGILEDAIATKEFIDNWEEKSLSFATRSSMRAPFSLKQVVTMHITYEKVADPLTRSFIDVIVNKEVETKYYLHHYYIDGKYIDTSIDYSMYITLLRISEDRYCENDETQ